MSPLRSFVRVAPKFLVLSAVWTFSPPPAAALVVEAQAARSGLATVAVGESVALAGVEDIVSGERFDLELLLVAGRRVAAVGRAFVGLNGGPAFRPSPAVSFMIVTGDQAETDRYWNAIIEGGGAGSACGWCTDRWGHSWQITPRVLTEAMAQGGDVAKRAFEAMMTMHNIDVAKIEAAVRVARND